jgi:hypothetical protein
MKPGIGANQLRRGLAESGCFAFRLTQMIADRQHECGRAIGNGMYLG